MLHSQDKLISRDSYYEHLRRDILVHVPNSAKTVLSVGCGTGLTEAELVRRGVEVFAIEIDHKAAVRARQFGLTVLKGNASEIDIRQVGKVFDCIIYADILEHLPDPVAVLGQHVERLQSNGTVIVSVPNFRHYSVFWQLFVLGRVKYMDAGILDRTHFRMTTRKMVLEWFHQIGLQSLSYEYNIPSRRDKLISAIFLGTLKEYLARKILLVGTKPL